MSWILDRALPAAALLVVACSEPRAERPNVLLVSIDMLRARHLACYGYERPTSPNIDRLAREGALFARHMSSTSWTLPAHAALFTGLADSVHGCTDSHLALHERFETLAERFAAAEYETAGFFAGPYLHPTYGLGQGFELYEDCTSAGAGATSAPGADQLSESHVDVCNPRSFAAFERWFAGRSGRPFFAFVHLWDVHYDFLPPPPYDRMFDPSYEGTRDGQRFATDPSISAAMPARDLEHLIALYDGEIAWTDAFVGRMRALLEAAGVFDDTIVILTSDHGTEFFEHGSKGHRKTLYDEVLHIPLVVRFPARVPAGMRIEKQTRMIDVAPTLLDLAGLSRDERHMGESLARLARDPSVPFPELALAELDTRTHAMRCVRASGWKLFQNREKGSPCAVDLARDPGERSLLCDPRHPLVDLGLRAAAEIDRSLAPALRAFGNARAASQAPAAVERHLRDLGYTGDDDAPR